MAAVEAWHDHRVIVFLTVIAVLVVGLVAAAATGRIAAGTPDPVSSRAFEQLPGRPLTGDDIAGLRFDQALRGYRMDEVDGVIERLVEELRDRDVEIALLRGERVDDPPVEG
jgi:DivIVA domain-containing protein